MSKTEPMIELSTSRDSLPCKLTPEEREERLTQAFAQVKRAGQARAKEASLKFQAKEAKEEADSADSEVKRLMSIVEAGAEYRSVECVEVYHEEGNAIRRVRTDTNEVVGTRPLNDLDKERIAAERQTGFGFEASKPKADKRKRDASDEVTGSIH